jgi:hypothetical protein
MNNKLINSLTHIDDKYLKEADEYKTSHKKHNYVFAAAAVAAVICISIALPFLMRENTADKITVSKIPIPSENTVSDSTGFLVYKGDVYVFSFAYKKGSGTYPLKLADEYLGHTNTHESSDLYSDANGDVYSVKGYDKAHMLCIINDKGNAYDIRFYVKNNGIELSDGASLFETGMKLSKGYQAVCTDNIDMADAGNLKALELSESDKKDIDSFIDEIDKAQFYKKSFSDEDIGNARNITFIMKDGTAVRMLLIKGGYVCANDYRGICVNIKGGVFDKIFDMCRCVKKT